MVDVVEACTGADIFLCTLETTEEDREFVSTCTLARSGITDIVRGYNNDLTTSTVEAIRETDLSSYLRIYFPIEQNKAIQAAANGEMELTVRNRADNTAADMCVAMVEHCNEGSTEY